MRADPRALHIVLCSGQCGQFRLGVTFIFFSFPQLPTLSLSPPPPLSLSSPLSNISVCMRADPRALHIVLCSGQCGQFRLGVTFIFFSFPQLPTLSLSPPPPLSLSSPLSNISVCMNQGRPKRIARWVVLEDLLHSRRIDVLPLAMLLMRTGSVASLGLDDLSTSPCGDVLRFEMTRLVL